MRSETLATVAMRVIETILKSLIQELINSLLFTQLNEVTNRFRNAINADDKEEKEAVAEMFQIRKQSFNNFFNVVKGLKLSKDATVKAAGKEVFSVLNMYGGLGFRDLSMTAHTQRYTTIIETLRLPEYTEALTKLNVNDFLTELADANTAYEAKYQVLGNKRSLQVPSSEMRTEMNNALKLMTDEVKIFVRKYPTEANIELLRNVEQRIAEVYVPAPGYTKRAKKSTTDTKQDNSTEVI